MDERTGEAAELQGKIIDFEMEILNIKQTSTMSLSSQKDTYEEVLKMKEDDIARLKTRLGKMTESLKVSEEELTIAL